jgi:hypothetical protein
MAKIIDVDILEAARQITLEVRFTKMREMKVRMWIATRLIILAAWITGMEIEVEEY